MAKTLPTLSTSRWRRKLILSEREEIKVELKAIKNDKKLRRHILDRIVELEDDHRAVGQLRRFIYCFYALYYHRYKKLFYKDVVKRLAGMAGAILRTQGVQPRKSELSFLHRDLHLLLSQIYQTQGNAWRSAWQQQLAYYYGEEGKPREQALKSMASGLRASRLGHFEVALQLLNQAETLGLDDRSLAHSRLEMVKLHRLSGNPQAASALIKDMLDNLNLDRDEQKELIWEKHCLELRSSLNPAAIVKAVRRKAEHNEESYVLDAFFWTRAMKEQEWIKRFPTHKHLSRNKSLQFRKFGKFHKAALTLQNLYNYEIPLVTRLEMVEGLVAEIHSMPSIERELLVLAALSRWLTRSRVYDFAALLISEYRGQSYRISMGRTDDVLGVVSDLYQFHHKSIKQIAA